jgi:hypothetical protein
MIGSPIFAGVLPACLGDLRAERPEWLPCLAGRAAPDAKPDVLTQERGPILATGLVTCRATCRAMYRSTCRAIAPKWARYALAVFAMETGGQTVAVHVDAAPGLRSGLDAWLADRDGAYAVPGESEHEVVMGARTVTLRKEGDLAVRAALGRDRTLALALVPILDDHGEVAGWLHVECEHHRLPSRARLAAMAAAWRADVLARSSRGTGVTTTSAGGADLDWARAESPEASLCATVFEELVADLGIKTAQRKWWGLVADGCRLVLRAAKGRTVDGRDAGRDGH